MKSLEKKWQYILFAVIVMCSVILAIFLVWFTESVFGLVGLFFILVCGLFEESQ